MILATQFQPPAEIKPLEALFFRCFLGEHKADVECETRLIGDGEYREHIETPWLETEVDGQIAVGSRCGQMVSKIYDWYNFIPESWLFTTYMRKPVVPWFGQKVRKIQG